MNTSARMMNHSQSVQILIRTRTTNNSIRYQQNNFLLTMKSERMRSWSRAVNEMGLLYLDRRRFSPFDGAVNVAWPEDFYVVDIWHPSGGSDGSRAVAEDARTVGWNDKYASLTTCSTLPKRISLTCQRVRSGAWSTATQGSCWIPGNFLSFGHSIDRSTTPKRQIRRRNFDTQVALAVAQRSSHLGCQLTGDGCADGIHFDRLGGKLR